MKAVEKGVTGDSDIFFYNASENSKELFFYLLCFGHFYCNGNYTVARTAYNSYLLFYVKNGKIMLESETGIYAVAEGSVCLVNCYNPHKYYALSDSEFYWFHFDGVMAQKYYQIILDINKNMITVINPNTFERCFDKFKTKPNSTVVYEAIVSKYITNLLTEIIVNTASDDKSDKNSYVEDIIDYVTEHLSDDLNIKGLAKRVSLSEHHLIRLFKKETGQTPHSYILSARLNFSKYMLETTDLSVKEICYLSGFNHESCFISAFKKSYLLSPMMYRNR